MKKFVVPLLLMCMFVPNGCDRETDPDKIAKNARTIYRASDSAMIIALMGIEQKMGQKKAVEIAEKIRKELDANVIPTLNDPNAQITKVVEDLLMKKLEFLDPNYRHILKSAFETLQEYYKSPTLQEALKEDGLSYLRALFNGFRNGADTFIINAK